MEKISTPIFYSDTKKRWKRFIGSIIFLSVFLLFSIIVFVITVFSDSSTLLPKITNRDEHIKKLLNPDNITTFKTLTNEDYKRWRRHLANTAEYKYGKHYKLNNVEAKPIATQIRAGFFVNWDLQSFYSLKNNISKINMVFPEWFFVTDSGNVVSADIDYRALSLMQKHRIPIVPMISNFFKEEWNGENVHRIISDKKNRTEFIHNILVKLKEFNFAGINIDFESLVEKGDENLINFQKELYEVLHSNGFIVTQDVAAFNTDYNLKELNKYNDYLILMAYDYHYPHSVPGPISPIKWVESAIYSITSKIPASKVIVGIPTYGYDWQQGDEGKDITYQEAIVIAKESDGNIFFHNDNYNLKFQYNDEDDQPHEVWFADAGTCFNTMRSSGDFQTAGVALWRLGGEDPRIWDFYGRDLSDKSLAEKPFDAQILRISPPSKNIDFEGEGEIMNIVATPDSGLIQIEYDNQANLITEQNYIKLPTSYVIKKYGKVAKKVVLTFDDGPSAEYTPAILDILKSENVPATFFIIGINAENNLNVLKRMYDEGFEIGNHSFTHPNLAEVNAERVMIELSTTRSILESITGHTTILFRPPYNADSEPETLDEIIPIAEAKKYNYYTVGESIDPTDWQKGITADSIVACVIRERGLGSIILLHDAGGDRSETIKALLRIIKYFRQNGYQFTTIANLLGKSRDYVMPPLADEKDIFYSKLNYVILETIFWGERLIFALFFIGILFSVGRTIIVAIIAWVDKRKNYTSPEIQGNPLVSVIVPAYNEEVHAISTVNNLLSSDYNNIEIVFVDDGSKDNTYNLIRKAFENNARVNVLTKNNGGKASALNFGISNAKGDIVLCIDADTQLKNDAISELLKHFNNEKIAAVAGNVKVGNKNKILTKWQSIEYITSQNFDRRAFNLLNCITVVPGAIGMFKKAAIIEVGGFNTDTLAEDCDITIKLLKAGYIVRNCSTALAYTEVPDTIKMFMKQRFRWSFGIMQSVWKHKEVLFRPSYKNLGMVAMPNALVFQFIMPLITPVADIVMVLSLMAGFWQQTLLYYLIFTAIDLLAAVVAFRFEKESIRDVWFLIPQRIFYRQLMYWILYKSLINAIRGRLIGWNVIKRTGTISVGG
jgi:peptidoglycan-N-acetylglucosamine deacetylase